MLPRGSRPESRIGRALHPAILLVGILCAACEPQTRRALVLDLTLTDPALLEATARPWRDAGYAVDYRRFYPHLAQADVLRYRTLLVLLGQAPEAPSDALTTGDLAMLSRSLKAGGVVVVGYSGDATGSLDRWTVNRWLASEGAGIGIGDAPLEDTTGSFGSPQPQPWAAGERVGGAPLGSIYDPFPFERNHALAVRDPSQVLAEAGRHAFVRSARNTAPRPDAPMVAATRVGQGLVVVVSRHALGALGPQAAPTTAPLLQLGALADTRDFLTALARWTRRPAEWAHVPPAEHPTSLTLAGAPLPVEVAAAPAAAPAGAITEPLGVPSPTDAGPVGVPAWVRQSGMRALWTPLLAPRLPGAAIRPLQLDSLVAFLDEAGLNLLAGDADAEALADSLHHWGDERSAVRHAWSEIATLLQPTSVAWIPALAAWPGRLLPVSADSSRGRPRGSPARRPARSIQGPGARASPPRSPPSLGSPDPSASSSPRWPSTSTGRGPPRGTPWVRISATPRGATALRTFRTGRTWTRSRGPHGIRRFATKGCSALTTRRSRTPSPIGRAPSRIALLTWHPGLLFRRPCCSAPRATGSRLVSFGAFQCRTDPCCSLRPKSRPAPCLPLTGPGASTWCMRSSCTQTSCGLGTCQS